MKEKKPLIEAVEELHQALHELFLPIFYHLDRFLNWLIGGKPD